MPERGELIIVTEAGRTLPDLAAIDAAEQRIAKSADVMRVSIGKAEIDLNKLGASARGQVLSALKAVEEQAKRTEEALKRVRPDKAIDPSSIVRGPGARTEGATLARFNQAARDLQGITTGSKEAAGGLGQVAQGFTAAAAGGGKFGAVTQEIRNTLKQEIGFRSFAADLLDIGGALAGGGAVVVGLGALALLTKTITDQMVEASEASLKFTQRLFSVGLEAKKLEGLDDAKERLETLLDTQRRIQDVISTRGVGAAESFLKESLKTDQFIVLDQRIKQAQEQVRLQEEFEQRNKASVDTSRRRLEIEAMIGFKIKEASDKLNEQRTAATGLIQSLSQRADDNPFARLITEASGRLQDFRKQFKDVGTDIVQQFEQVSTRVLALDLFKADLLSAGRAGSLLLDAEKLRQDRATALADQRTQREALIREIETGRSAGTLGRLDQFALLDKISKIGERSPVDLRAIELAEKAIADSQAKLSQFDPTSATGRSAQAAHIDFALAALQRVGPEKLTSDLFDTQVRLLEQKAALELQLKQDTQALAKEQGAQIQKLLESTAQLTESLTRIEITDTTGRVRVDTQGGAQVSGPGSEGR